MEAFLGLMIPILSVIGTFTFLIVLRGYENKERMAAIDKGLPLDSFKRKGPKSGVLVSAGLLIGAGIGLFLAFFIDNALNMDEVAYFSMLFICGGFGLVIGRKMAIKEEEKMDQ